MENLNNKQVAEISLKIIEVLNGIPMGEAIFILGEAKNWLLDSHFVDTSNQRFKAKSEEVQGCGSSLSLSEGQHHQ